MALTMDDGVITVDENDPVAVAARLRQLEADLGSAPAHVLDGLAGDVGVVQSWLAAYLAKLTARAGCLQRQGQPADARKTAARAGFGPREADKAARRGDAMSKMPDALKALEDGDIGVGHADVMARQANRLSGSKKRQFEEQAAGMVKAAVREDLPVPAFEKRCRQVADRLMDDDGVGEYEKQRRNSRAKTWVDDDTGMTHLQGEWDPVRGEAITRALKAEIAARISAGASGITKRQRAQLMADAIHGLLTGDRRSSPTAASAVVFHIAWDAIVDGQRTGPDGTARTAESQGGQSVPVETIRRAACDAGIIPVVLGGAGQPLDVGRERRLATNAQRIALRAQYPTCGMDEDCNVAFDDCQIHHVDLWKHGGHTDLDRMCPGCDDHHHLVHEGGWTLTRNRDGTWQLHPPQRPPP